MIINDVEDDRDTGGVRCGDEPAETGGTSVGGFDGEGVRRVVTPGDIAGKFGSRHDLDGVDADRLQVRDTFRRIVEGADAILLSAREGAYVQFVDHELVPRRDAKTVVRGANGGAQDAVADGVRHLAGARVDFGKFAGAVDEVEAVGVPRGGLGNFAVPVAGVVAHERVFRFVETVEITDHGNGAGVRRPDAEGETLVERNGPHSWNGRVQIIFIGHKVPPCSRERHG